MVTQFHEILDENFDVHTTGGRNFNVKALHNAKPDICEGWSCFKAEHFEFEFTEWFTAKVANVKHIAMARYVSRDLADGIFLVVSIWQPKLGAFEVRTFTHVDSVQRAAEVFAMLTEPS